MELVGLAIFTMLIFSLLPGGRRRRAQDRRRVIANTAKRLNRELTETFSGAHELSKVNLDDYPDLDREFYRRVGTVLEEKGFRLVGDIEDETSTRANPRMRTCVRVWVSRDGLIRAGAAHIPLRLFGVRLLGWIGLVPRKITVVDFVTEERSGRFITTSNTGEVDRLSLPDAIDSVRLPMATSVVSILGRHQQRLRERADHRPHRGDGPPFSPVGLATYDELVASWQRQLVVVSRHRQALGGVTEEELEAFTGKTVTASDREVLLELRTEAQDKSSAT